MKCTKKDFLFYELREINSNRLYILTGLYWDYFIHAYIYCTIQINPYRHIAEVRHKLNILHTNRRTHTTRESSRESINKWAGRSLALWSTRIWFFDKSNKLPNTTTGLSSSTGNGVDDKEHFIVRENKSRTARNYCDDNNPSPFSLCSFDRPDLLELQFSFWGPDRRRGFASERHGGQYRYPYAWHIYITYDLPQSGVETKNIASS